MGADPFTAAIGLGGSLLSGAMGSDAAGDAAAAQGRSADQAVQFQRDALKQVRGDLAPYRDAGTNILYGGERYDQAAFDAAQRDFWAKDPVGTTTKTRGNGKTVTKNGKGYLDLKGYQALSPEERMQYVRNDKGQFVLRAPELTDFKLNPSGGLLDLVSNPEAQKNFVMQNPFFDALAKKSSDTLLANQAAKGKVGSGGTAEALQNSLLLLGSDLLNQNITQRQNIANMGAAAAAQTATATQGNANSISELYQSKGNSQAAGIMGANNAWNTAIGGFNMPSQSGGGKYGGGYTDTNSEFGRINWYPINK